jgi:hypothetical protein
LCAQKNRVDSPSPAQNSKKVTSSRLFLLSGSGLVDRVESLENKYSDYLKMVMYHNCGGPRMASYIDSVGSTIFGDIPKQQLLELEYRVMNYQEGGYEQIPFTGLSSDYVYREAKRAVEGAAGTKTQIWPGIDIDIPTGANHSKSTPQGTKDAVMAAFRAGAHGVILSRKYSEMKLANLSGAGEAIKELGLS